MNTYFYLTRHGESQWNQCHRLQGQLDSELTEKGKIQASVLGQKLQNTGIDLIVSSPLKRARQTADICQKYIKSDSVENKQLMERHFGDWQGKYYSSLFKEPGYRDIFQRVTEQAPPKGESGLDCQARMHQALKQIAASYKSSRLLVICHGEAMRCFLSQFNLNTSGDAYSQFDNASITPLSYCHHTARFSQV